MQAQRSPRLSAWLTRSLLLTVTIGVVWALAAALPTTSSAFARSCPGNPNRAPATGRATIEAPRTSSAACATSVAARRAGAPSSMAP